MAAKYDEINLTGLPNNELYNKSPEIEYDLFSTFDKYLDSYALWVRSSISSKLRADDIWIFI